jgi:tetratricopeptide (TPR) repeat protein
MDDEADDRGRQDAQGDSVAAPDEHTDAARWQRVKALLAEALELDAGGQQALLARVGAGDAALRDELASLIEAARGDDGLEAMPQGFALAALEANTRRSWVGRRLGPWRVLSLIGSGGMGKVWRAERADGQFEQFVAVKAMHEGVDRADLVARFHAERRILASLDHPNLAKVIDGGTAEDGVPYFVMELIDGEPIDLYCERLRLDVPARLRLFRSVCQVVHHAHQKHVVHRDLKADNILVTREGVVKLVDFGIAKRTDPTAAEPPTRTATAQRVMTLVYSSPEQVRGEEITPASDVYSLGVVLYKLLAKASPYPASATDSAYELTRAICDTEPVLPSEAAPALRRSLRGDLDAVVTMALRKEPARRYASAEAMSEDLFRHLEGLPVQARRGAWNYRAGRFLLRHRIVVGAILAANLALVAGIAATGYEAWQANRQRERAERNSASVRKLADMLIFDIHDAIRDLPGATQARKLVIERGLAYLVAQQAEFTDDPALQVDIGTGYRKIGELQARPHMANLGDLAGARDSYRRAREVLLPLVRQLPPGDERRQKAMLELIHVDEFEAAALISAGQLKPATALMQRARERSAELDALRPKDPFIDYRRALQYANHASLLHTGGDLAGYVQASDEATRLFGLMHQRMPADPDVTWGLAAQLNDRGIFIMDQGATPEAGRQAEALLRRSLALWEQLRREHPESAFFPRNVGSGRNNLGEALILAGRYDDAQRELRQSIDITQALAAKDPADQQLAVYRSVEEINLARALLGQGQRDTAQATAREALKRLAALPEAAVSDAYVMVYRALGHHTLALASVADAGVRCGAEREALALLQGSQAKQAIPPGSLQIETVQAALARCPGDAKAAR